MGLSRITLGIATAIAFAVPIALFYLPSIATTESPHPRAADDRIRLSDGWIAMGTFFEVELRVPAESSQTAIDWLRFAREEIQRLEAIYSRHDPSSELAVLNRSLLESPASVDEGALSNELRQLLRDAERIRIETGGSFDVSIGSLRDFWTSAGGRERRPTNSKERESVLARTQASDSKVLSPMRANATRLHSALQIDLDGLSKGAVLDHLRRDFVRRFPSGAALLNFGQSSIAAVGDPDGGGWRLQLQSRDPGRGRFATLRLRDQSLSMSSSIPRQRGGADVESNSSTIIDPRLESPVPSGIETAVVSDSAMQADAWSTALLVLGGTPSSLKRLDSVDFEWLLIDDADRTFQSPRWSEAVVSLPSSSLSWRSPSK